MLLLFALPCSRLWSQAQTTSLAYKMSKSERQCSNWSLSTVHTWSNCLPFTAMRMFTTHVRYLLTSTWSHHITLPQVFMSYVTAVYIIPSTNLQVRLDRFRLRILYYPIPWLICCYRGWGRMGDVEWCWGWGGKYCYLGWLYFHQFDRQVRMHVRTHTQTVCAHI